MSPRETRRSYVRVGPEVEALLEGWSSGGGGGQRVEIPTDVFITDDPPSVTVQLDVSGIDPAATQVALEDQILIVQGNRMPPPRGGRRKYQQAEIEWGAFERRLRIGVPVDGDNAEASYQRGVLTISLPIVEREPPTGPPVVILRVRQPR